MELNSERIYTYIREGLLTQGNCFWKIFWEKTKKERLKEIVLVFSRISYRNVEKMVALNKWKDCYGK